jgi:hypothetical protein
MTPSSLEIFAARCEARARLWQVGQISLHEAVDELWVDAFHRNLIAEVGGDKLQAIIAKAFAQVRDDLGNR